MKQDYEPELILFAANPIHQLCPMFVRGSFIEVEMYEYGHERDWSDAVPEPPGIGMWVWEFEPTGGSQNYWGEYDEVDIDKGKWRPLTAREWHFLQQGEPPWEPVREYDCSDREGGEQDQGNLGI